MKSEIVFLRFTSILRLLLAFLVIFLLEWTVLCMRFSIERSGVVDSLEVIGFKICIRYGEAVNSSEFALFEISLQGFLPLVCGDDEQNGVECCLSFFFFFMFLDGF